MLQDLKVYIDKSLQQESPIDFGVAIHNAKQKYVLSNISIAEHLSINKNLIGQYCKMSKWSETIKKKIKDNKDHITNTRILLWARHNTSEFKIEQELTALEKNIDNTPKKITEDKTHMDKEDNLYTLPSGSSRLKTQSDVSNKHPKSLTWAQIESVFLSPEASILAILITVFSSYLIYQGTIFFQNMELNLLESVLSSFFGEILCVTTAGLFVVSSTRFSKFLSGVILLFSVVFLALFLHRGVENQLQKSTPEYKRLEQSFSELKQEIKELREEKKQFPANFISKKEQKQTQINSKLKEKNQLSIELSYLEKESSIGVSGYYNAWLRIALMLINVLLVHRFFVYFKPRCS